MKNIIKGIISGLFLILSIYLVTIINDLDVLPDRYFTIIVASIVSVNIFAALLLFVKGKITTIIASLLYIILLIASVVGIKYGNETNDFLDKAFNNNTYETTTYNVLVLSDSKINKISDLEKLDIHYLNDDVNKDDMLDNITSKVNSKLNPEKDMDKMYSNLIKGKITAIVLDVSYIDILRDDHKVDEETKVVYTFEIKHKSKDKSRELKELKPMNIYISGSDSREATIYNKSRSDVNMILTINPSTNTILMTSIPRDYYVQVYGKTGLKDKLTHSGIYGVDVSRKTLENFFGIDIDYSIKVNFNSVVELVDLVGGIDIDSDKEFNSYHIKGWKVQKGVQHMDGRHALAYARERYAYKSGDNHRVMNQQQVLEATMKKIMSDESILLKYDKLLESFSNFYVTDIPSSAIKLFVKNQLDNKTKWKFVSQKVSGTGLMTNTYTGPNLKRWVMIPDEKSVKEAKEKIERTLTNNVKIQ